MMMQQQRSMVWKSALVFTLTLLIDRITKQWALLRCAQEYVINRYVSCELMFNRGISWSLFDSQNSLVFIAVSAVIALVIALFMVSSWQQYRQGKSLMGPSLILSGALSNFADRILYGGVIDFIAIGPWPVFNVADALICCGIALMLWNYKE